jgi:hypothetical protein
MTLLEWLDRVEEARIVAGELTDPTARKAVLQPKPMCVSEPRLGQFVPTARSSQQAAISGLASATTTANRTEEPRHTLSAFIYVISVALVAAATIVSFGVASFSFLNTNEEAALRAFNRVLSNLGLAPARRVPQKAPLGMERCRLYLFLTHNATRSFASSRCFSATMLVFGVTD